jgi:hypothetical protein
MPLDGLTSTDMNSVSVHQNTPTHPSYSRQVTDAPREEAARACEVAAEELDRAVQHCRTAAQHYRDGKIPRGAAHAWAAFGHVRTADEALAAQARSHAQRSNPI